MGFPLITCRFAEISYIVGDKAEPRVRRTISGNLIGVKLNEDGVAHAVFRQMGRGESRNRAICDTGLHRICGWQRWYRPQQLLDPADRRVDGLAPEDGGM